MKKTFINSFFLTLVVALFSATNVFAEDVTFDFAANEWKHPTASALDKAKAYIVDGLEKDGVNLVFKYGTSSSMPYYNNTGPRVVLASNQIMKVFAPAGKAIVKISFTHGSNFNLNAEGLSGDNWIGNATCVKFKATGTAQINSMVVTLADKTGETVTPAAEAEEDITVDFDDNDTHSEFKNDDSEITADINVIDKAGSTGESRLYTLIPKTTSTSALVSKNKWYYISSEFTNTLRIFNEKMVFKTDPDKVIKSITMKVKTWNSTNKINGETVTKSQIQAGVDVNANVVEFEPGGQSVIYTITAVIADKPAAAPIAPVAFVPAENSTVGSYFSAAFTAKFDEALTLDASKASDIKLYKGSVAAENEIAPEAGAWTAQLQNSKKELYIFSMDEYGEAPQTIITEEGQKYILVIPAGIVKNASDVANSELTLTLNGPAPTVKMVSADPANNSTKSSSFAATFNITFDKEITIDNSKASSVKLYIDEVGGTEIAPESGAWSLEKESDGKTLRVFSLDEYGEGPQIITPEAGKKYILVVPAATVKNGDAENKEIKITINGPAAPITATSFDPADNSTVGSYFNAAFTAKFDEALTLDASKASDIKLYKGSVAAGNEIAPEAGAWTAQLQNSNKELYIFSFDEYGEGVQTITAEEGQKYILVIPAGIVKNASGVSNDELTLTLNGPAPTIKMTSANPANNSEVSSTFAATFNITFDKAITINNAKAADVKLYVDAVGGTEIAPEAGAWSLSKESDGKTLRIFSLDEYSEGPQFITPAVGKKYILVVPAGIVKSAAEAENEEIKITLVCPEPAPIAPTAFDPAEGSVLPNYFSASFTAKFDEPLTLDDSKIASIKLYEKMGETTTELTPDDSWKASLESGKKNLFVWASDYDGFTQGFSAKEGAKYQLVIPAGIVKNAANVANDELMLTLNGPVPTVSLVSTDPVDGAKLAAGYTAKSFSLTFSKAVSTTDELINSGVTLKKNGAVVDTESWGFSLSNENKTVQVFGKDMDGFVDTYQVAAGDVFVLTVAKDVFTTADGAKNDEIQVTLNGPELVITELVLESSNPADGAVLEAGYQPMTFNLTFAEATTTTAEKLNAGVTLTKNGTKVDVESWGFSLSNENKTVQLFGMDMDGYTDSYKVEEGDVFVLTIAKGVFTAPTAQNEEIKITLNGPAAAAAFNPTKIEPGDGDELFKFYANFAMPHLELTFDENIAAILATKPAIELRKGSVDGEVLPISGWKAELVDETPNMLTLDAWDYNVGSNIWFEAEDVDYYWIIPAGIVKNAAGGQNEQIVLKQKGIVKNLTVVSTTPVDKGTIAPASYVYYQFYVTFEEEIQIAVEKPNDVMFYQNGEKKLPSGSDTEWFTGEDIWHALKDNANTLYIWGDDGTGYVDSYAAIDGATYKLVIPAGVVKDAMGNVNGEITIEFACSSGTGIAAVKSAAGKSGERYNLNGVRINGSKKGVQIIRTEDGRIVKVSVK